MPELHERAPRRRKRTTLTGLPRPQTRKQRCDFSSFDHPDATYMFLRPSKDFVLWNSTAAMRRNGFRPSEIAGFLSSEYGIEIYDPRRKNAEKPSAFEALAFFEKLVIRKDVQAPSLVYDHAWGNA